MEQFNLDKWLKYKSRKVVTRDGRNVRIVCWDRQYAHNDFPIIALEEWDNGEFVNFVSSNGKVDLSGSENIHDLFFADEVEELTEFEQKLVEILKSEGAPIGNIEKFTDKDKEDFHCYSKQLLDLARKEILEDLPKWKKITKPEQKYLAYGFLSWDGYYLSISGLKRKLSKEK